MSGVGISFGADRIYDVLAQLDGFPKDAGQTTQVLFINFGAEEAMHALPLLNQVRQAGFNAEIYAEPVKMKKQMAYANAKHVAFVALLGADEAASGRITVKTMETGEQCTIGQDELVDWLARQ